MGLDMCLYRKTSVKNWDYSENKYEVIVTKNGEPHSKIDADKICEVQEEIGYWRKANAIHGWIVENVADGVDDCSEIYIPFERIKELQDLCKEVLKKPHKAADLLPVTTGFFFGTYEYDEWYFDSLSETVGILDQCREEDWIVYQASW